MEANHQSSKYWIIVGSIDNLRRTAELGFTIQGMKSRHRKKAERMQPGDKIVYYVTGIKAFAGIATVTSKYFESHDQIWKSNDPKRTLKTIPSALRSSAMSFCPKTSSSRRKGSRGK